MDPVTEVIDKAFAAALYADGDAGLDTGASLLAAAPEADAELRRRGEELVRRAWERGWQPADVVRMVRRAQTDSDPDQARLAAELITGETRRYGDTLPPRWRAQLAELAPDADPAARPRPTDRFSRATTTLALYRTLLRLPPIEPVGPAPGTPLHTPPPPGHEEPRILTRIRALLAKAEATGFPEEAEALTAKAQELMARHTIDEALLASRTHAKNTPGACRIGVDAPYETAKAILLDAVATANHCRAVWNEAYGFSTVVGFEPDLEVMELLHTSLLLQGTTAMTKAEAGQRAGGRKRTKTFRQAFLLAYANRLGARLAATAEHVADESPEAGELLPVLAARDVAVTASTERMFPATTTTRVRGATDAEGWHSGTTAADQAHLPPSARSLP
ncbi:DUF2786 domain-containing protein [Streptomyces sp. NBC_01381]|uniref:DUF2786 domain-containing protein n=1 Tax=Streptomyces sp. NBC_01381 TaxID=2903845 RepID=UPI0022500FFD|nr:DUF2786 domain-containing protein [Streptomyces sp. NBC_01381]MCX4665440.1 DUF2786 domain-containing protein [Streptomyces sp. NBC_01381]